MRHLEEDLQKWQVMVDNVTGVSPQDFDAQTLAVLRGRLVRYLMRSKEVRIDTNKYSKLRVTRTPGKRKIEIIDIGNIEKGIQYGDMFIKGTAREPPDFVVSEV